MDCYCDNVAQFLHVVMTDWREWSALSHATAKAASPAATTVAVDESMTHFTNLNMSTLGIHIGKKSTNNNMCYKVPCVVRSQHMANILRCLYERGGEVQWYS